VTLWYERWNVKIIEGKTQAIYFSIRLRVPGDVLQVNGRNIPFINNVTFNRRMTWTLLIERTAGKALGTYIRIYSLFRCENLSINIKVILYKALIRSIMVYACPTREYAADTHLLKLQLLQNRVLCSVGNLERCTWSMNCMWLSQFLTCSIT
jgi:hypothetical protein